MVAAGYGFGPQFRQIQNVWFKTGEALAEIEVPAILRKGLGDYCFHPAVLDACFQVFRAVQTSDSVAAGRYLFLPAAVRRIRVGSGPCPERLWAQALQTSQDSGSLVCDIRVYDDAGAPFAEILGFQVDRAERQAAHDAVENCFYRFQWELCRIRGTGTEGSCQFAATADMVAAADRVMPELYERYGLGDYHRDFLPRCEQLNAQYCQNALIKLGWTARPGERVTFTDLARRLGIARQHQRVMRIQLEGLVHAGILRDRGDDSWDVPKPLVARDPRPLIAELSTDYPRLAPNEITLSCLNGEVADRLLSGEISATEILFPGGSSKLVGSFYVEGLDFPAHNRLMATAVAKAVEHLPARRALRVLEIGAGTGSLTKEVLPILPPDRTEYLFTDIGPAFVTAAKSQFAKFPFVDYRTFDLEHSAADQGLAIHGYDLILASAVLHATEDLRRTLENIRTCLAPGAVLMFIEPIHRRLVTDSIFGGLPGWWKFTDTDLRPDHALMGHSNWIKLLKDLGFGQVNSILSAPTEQESEQAIFVAVAPEPAAVRSERRESDRTSRNGSAHGAALNGTVSHSQSRSPVGEEVPPSIVDSAATHMVFVDQSGLAPKLVERFQHRGDRVVKVRIGQSFRREGRDEFTLPPTAVAELRELFAEIGPLTSIVHCWSLDHPSASSLATDRLEQAQESGVLSVLRIAQALIERTEDKPPRVYLITRDTQHVLDGDRGDRIASSALVGFARVANAEHVPYRWTVIDLAATSTPHEADDLFQELTLGDKELEVAYREDRRYANRLHRASVPQLPPRLRVVSSPIGSVTPFRLQIEKPGVLTNLSWNETPRVAPGPTQLEVRLVAGGINFRDVMKTLGMYPGNPVDLRWLGDDFA
ncbi:MAG TPA: polyketide synthase dehydratase domain-containing protein, partial [Pirellulaceae bacterium]